MSWGRSSDVMGRSNDVMEEEQWCHGGGAMMLWRRSNDVMEEEQWCHGEEQ